MWPLRSRRTEVYLGSETDDELCARLISSIESMSGKKIRMDTDCVGSQELTSLVYRVGTEKIVITIETFSGITLSGERSLVEKIAAQVRGD